MSDHETLAADLQGKVHVYVEIAMLLNKAVPQTYMTRETHGPVSLHSLANLHGIANPCDSSSTNLHGPDDTGLQQAQPHNSPQRYLQRRASRHHAPPGET